MSTKSFILALATLVTGAGVGVVAAQHLSSPGPSDRTSSLQMQLVHSCGQAGDAGASQPHVPAELANALELTTIQQADISRIGVEACSAMTRIHDQMLGVLTPEQRAKVQAMHNGGHDSSGIHEWFRKLHGGK